MIPGRWCVSDAIVLRSPSLGASRRTSPPDSAHAAGCGMAPRQLPPVLAGLAMPGLSARPVLGVVTASLSWQASQH